MRNITLTCPECSVPSKAVGDPDEETLGTSGAWYCFNCGAKGDFDIRYFNIEVPEDAQA